MNLGWSTFQNEQTVLEQANVKSQCSCCLAILGSNRQRNMDLAFAVILLLQIVSENICKDPTGFHLISYLFCII